MDENADPDPTSEKNTELKHGINKIINTGADFDLRDLGC